MDSQKLNEILNLPTDEKLELVYAIWDSIRDEVDDSEIPEWHKGILDERLKKLKTEKLVL